jgi:hypothetical protein
MAKRSQQSDDLSRLMGLAGQRRAGNAACEGHAQGEQKADEAGCIIRELPERLRVDAAGVAAAVNPVNMPQAYLALASSVPEEPLALTLSIGKYFGPLPRTLTVSFLEATPTTLRDRILLHMNAWNRCCGVRFRFTTGTGQVRISRAGAGYWSYLGTDILLIPQNKPTMNLQAFSMTTSEAEYRRVVRHETGHTLGFPHEHMRSELVNRIDKQKAYAYFAATQGWSKAQVDAQVLTPLNQATIIGTPADQTSVMCYRLPGSITKNGQPILGGPDINATDCAFAGRVYPRIGAAPAAPGAGADEVVEELAGGGAFEDISADWAPEEDVDPAAAIEELIGGYEPAD